MIVIIKAGMQSLQCLLCYRLCDPISASRVSCILYSRTITGCHGTACRCHGGTGEYEGQRHHSRHGAVQCVIDRVMGRSDFAVLHCRASDVRQTDTRSPTLSCMILHSKYMG